MKTFVMAWNAGQTDIWQKDVLAFLDIITSDIKNYYVPFLGTILLVTDDTKTAAGLAGVIHLRFPTLLFQISPVDPYFANGWMPELYWGLVNNPKPSPRWDALNSGALLSLLSGMAGQGDKTKK